MQERTTVDEHKAVLLPVPGAATVPAHPALRDYLVLFALACGPCGYPVAAPEPVIPEKPLIIWASGS